VKLLLIVRALIGL